MNHFSWGDLDFVRFNKDVPWNFRTESSCLSAPSFSTGSSWAIWSSSKRNMRNFGYILAMTSFLQIKDSSFSRLQDNWMELRLNVSRAAEYQSAVFVLTQTGKCWKCGGCWNPSQHSGYWSSSLTPEPPAKQTDFKTSWLGWPWYLNCSCQNSQKLLMLLCVHWILLLIIIYRNKEQINLTVDGKQRSINEALAGFKVRNELSIKKWMFRQVCGLV